MLQFLIHIPFSVNTSMKIFLHLHLLHFLPITTSWQPCFLPILINIKRFKYSHDITYINFSGVPYMFAFVYAQFKLAHWESILAVWPHCSGRRQQEKEDQWLSFHPGHMLYRRDFACELSIPATHPLSPITFCTSLGWASLCDHLPARLEAGTVWCDGSRLSRRLAFCTDPWAWGG